MTTEVTASNIAALVKASEALAETVRRTRDALMVVGLVTSAGQVLDAIAADMVDSVVDGRGATGSSARIAAVWNLVSAQVLLEALINHLHVGGVDATVAMDIAIQQVMPNSPAVPLTSSVAITGEMLVQTRVVLDAARLFTGDPAIAGMLQMLDLIQSGVAPENVESLLPDGSSSALNGAIAQMSAGAAAEHEIVNAIVRQDDLGPNRAPSISGTPLTSIVQGGLYEFTPTSNDPDADPLSFTIANRPAWASFDPTSGRLSGTPNSSAVGTYPNISISVSDGVLTDTLSAFAVAVVGAPNNPPVISGSPLAQVIVGNTYDFTPTAADPDADPLSFTIANRPAWASFDPTSGRLSGTPNSSAVGTYPNISISVSDGAASATLPAFSVSVVSTGTNVATLSWIPPTENVDGSPLLDLSGYKIYFGTTQGNYTELVNLANPGLTMYVADTLGSGTYYFVITAYDSTGNESVYSNVASKTMN
jgi:hypothetical protein